MIKWFFEKWAEDNRLCVDIYLGSGSTLMACEISGKKCYGMELDEHYCDVIINRWQEYTGKKAIRESDNKQWDDIEWREVVE